MGSVIELLPQILEASRELEANSNRLKVRGHRSPETMVTNLLEQQRKVIGHLRLAEGIRPHAEEKASCEKRQKSVRWAAERIQKAGPPQIGEPGNQIMNMEVRAMAIKHTIRTKMGDDITREVSLTPLKAIRYQCLECMCWSPKGVSECTDVKCSLHPYRFGNNPAREGIGWRRKEENLINATSDLILDSQESLMS